MQHTLFRMTRVSDVRTQQLLLENSLLDYYLIIKMLTFGIFIVEVLRSESRLCDPETILYKPFYVYFLYKVVLKYDGRSFRKSVMSGWCELFVGSISF